MFPLSNQGKVLTFVTALDPLSYGIDGMRGVLLGKTNFGSFTDLMVLVVVGAILLVFGAYRFSKIEV
jgi:ABC-2 type transport system permease protein